MFEFSSRVPSISFPTISHKQNDIYILSEYSTKIHKIAKSYKFY